MWIDSWTIITILIPAIGSIVCFLAGERQSARVGILTSTLMLVAAAMLALTIWNKGPFTYAIGGWESPLGIQLYADGLSALMVCTTALVGFFISLYARSYFVQSQGSSREVHVTGHGYFWPLWLFCLSSMAACFLSADLFNIYVTLELIGLSSVALVALAGGIALTSAIRYLFVTLTGSLMYLFAVALLYGNYGILDFYTLGELVAPTPASWAALTLITLGMLLKTALFPLHFWLPPAHANAPAPVSALLSALVVKASFYLYLRLWLVVFDDIVTIQMSQVLALLAVVAILWGSIQAFRQRRIKMLVAYSTVAQIGYLFLVFPIASGGSTLAWNGGVYHALSHAFAKAAMFLAAGTVIHAIGHDRIDKLAGAGKHLPVTFFAFGLASISLMGLPPSGGYIAKWLLLEAATQAEQWILVGTIYLGGLLAAAYVFRILQKAFSSPLEEFPGEVVMIPRLMEWTPFALAVVSILLGFASNIPLTLLEISPAYFNLSGGPP